MAAVNGTALVIQIDTVAISCQTDSSSFNIDRDMIETTCKDASGSAKTFIPGEYGSTIDGTAVYDQTATEGYSEAFSDIVNGTSVAWKWGSTAAGETYYSGNGYLSNVSAEAPQNDRATYSFTIQVSGEVTEAQNPT